jgi:ketosteroid isomerase-like protein
MGADENLAIVRRGYEAFNKGDMETLTELFDEGAAWHLPGRSSLAGDHEGRDAAFAYFAQLGQETGGTFQAELQHLLADDGGRVISIQRNTAERLLTVGTTWTTSTLGTSSGRSASGESQVVIRLAGSV